MNFNSTFTTESTVWTGLFAAWAVIAAATSTALAVATWIVYTSVVLPAALPMSVVVAVTAGLAILLTISAIAAALRSGANPGGGIDDASDSAEASSRTLEGSSDVRAGSRETGASAVPQRPGTQHETESEQPSSDSGRGKRIVGGTTTDDPVSRDEGDCDRTGTDQPRTVEGEPDRDRHAGQTNLREGSLSSEERRRKRTTISPDDE
ncbi:hypothetical protein HTG_01255 [Natrinema mahii]|nr:hypothetical protein HTG_01255 [Natrinema mahii]